MKLPSSALAMALMVRSRRAEVFLERDARRRRGRRSPCSRARSCARCAPARTPRGVCGCRKTGKSLPTGLKPRASHLLRRGADDHPVAILHRQAEQFVADGAADGEHLQLRTARYRRHRRPCLRLLTATTSSSIAVKDGVCRVLAGPDRRHAVVRHLRRQLGRRPASASGSGPASGRDQPVFLQRVGRKRSSAHAVGHLVGRDHVVGGVGVRRRTARR